MENSMKFPQKLKIELPYDIAIPLLGIYPKKMKTLIWKGICTSLFIAALFTIARSWKQPKCSLTDEWIKMWYVCMYVYTHSGIVLSHKKGWNLAICDNIDGPIWYYAKWSKSDRERQILYDFTYMWTLKDNINEQIKQKMSYRFREETGICQRGGCGERKE